MRRWIQLICVLLAALACGFAPAPVRGFHPETGDLLTTTTYGLTTSRTGTNDTPFLYNGRYGVQTDPTGLLYMRARYYNPFICRFINADPSGFAGGLNWYAYAGGNPVSMVDPFGLGAVGAASSSSWINDIWSGLGVDNSVGAQQQRQDTLTGFADFATMGIANDVTTAATGYDFYGSRATSQERGVAAVMAAMNFVPLDRVGLAGAKVATEVGEIAAETAPKLLNPGINVTEQGMQHALERHIVNGIPEYASRSKFTTGVNLEELIQQGTQMPMVRQANGYFARTFEAGSAIGINRATGQATSTVTIITKPNGNLVTMFPGTP